MQDGEEEAIQLTLVPLRPGALFLPSVAIRPLPSSNYPLSCETQHLNAAAVSIVTETEAEAELTTSPFRPIFLQNIEVLPIASQSLFVLDLDGIVV